MKMKKLILFMAVVVIALSVMGGLALAGGWTDITYTVTHDPDDTNTADGTAYWNPTTPTGSPHGNFSATSNRCRVCHAVHLANSDSWRLLGSSDSNDPCKACHGDTGLTVKRPYGPKTYVADGEHTLGETDIPDATVTTTLAAGLGCNTCHSVHGAGTITSGAGVWNTRLLRTDPNRDGTDLATGLDGVDGAGANSIDESQTNFCADCHSNNPNWNDGADTNPRANSRSHVQGGSADGTLAVNGVDTKVAGFGGSVETSGTTEAGCRDCHAASSAGNSVASLAATSTGNSAFPHQTKGSKLLFDSYDGDIDGGGTTATDPNRVLEGMDELCGKCHTDTGDIDSYTSGVGKTF